MTFCSNKCRDTKRIQYKSNEWINNILFKQKQRREKEFILQQTETEDLGIAKMLVGSGPRGQKNLMLKESFYN